MIKWISMWKHAARPPAHAKCLLSTVTPSSRIILWSLSPRLLQHCGCYGYHHYVRFSRHSPHTNRDKKRIGIGARQSWFQVLAQSLLDFLLSGSWFSHLSNGNKNLELEWGWNKILCVRGKKRRKKKEWKWKHSSFWRNGWDHSLLAWLHCGLLRSR